MRTTVTIEADTEALLREEAQRMGLSLKEVLNRAIRRSLQRRDAGQVHLEPLFTQPFPAELAGLSMNRLADALDDDETLRELVK